MNLLDYYDIVMGNKYCQTNAKSPYRYEEGDDLKASELFQTISQTAMDNLERTNNANAFYKAEPDLAVYIPPAKRSEYFYLMKTGKYSKDVPAKFIFMLEECYKQHGTYNMLFKFIPQGNIKEITSCNYLNGNVKIFDVIKSLDPNFTPISKDNKIVRNGDYYDVYIPKTDRIAIVPEKVAKCLDETKLDSYNIIKNELVTETGYPVCKLGGYIGIHSNTYDMRDLI